MKEEKICGIYKIQNKKNGKIYIGQTVDFTRRVNEYRNRKASEMKSSLYYVMEIIENEGFEYFDIELIYPCLENELDKYEMFYINTYKSYLPDIGYNSFHLDENGKLVVNERTRERMRLSHIGLKETNDTKRKKSKKIIALDDISGLLIISDSAKLFGDMINTDRSVISACIKNARPIYGYYLYYYDEKYRNEILDKIKNMKNGIRNISYLAYGELLNTYSVETIEKDFTVINLTYDLFE